MVNLKRSRKNRFPANEITLAITGLFALAASIRGDHWRKEPAQVSALGEPLSAWLNTLPVKATKRIEGASLPFVIILALILLLADPIREEKRLYANRRSNAKPNEGTVPGEEGRIMQYLNGSGAVPSGASGSDEGMSGPGNPGNDEHSTSYH